MAREKVYCRECISRLNLTPRMMMIPYIEQACDECYRVTFCTTEYHTKPQVLLLPQPQETIVFSS